MSYETLKHAKQSAMWSTGTYGLCPVVCIARACGFDFVQQLTNEVDPNAPPSG